MLRGCIAPRARRGCRRLHAEPFRAPRPRARSDAPRRPRPTTAKPRPRLRVGRAASRSEKLVERHRDDQILPCSTNGPVSSADFRRQPMGGCHARRPSRARGTRMTAGCNAPLGLNRRALPSERERCGFLARNAADPCGSSRCCYRPRRRRCERRRTERHSEMSMGIEGTPFFRRQDSRCPSRGG